MIDKIKCIFDVHKLQIISNHHELLVIIIFLETHLLIEIPSSSFINFLHLTSRNAALFFGMSGELAFLHLHI